MANRRTRRTFREQVIIALVLLAPITLSSQILAADDAPNLVGTWSGVHTGGAYVGSPGHSPDQSEPTFLKPGMRFTLTIKQQDGRGLIGSWSSPQKTERIVGAVRLDNKTIVLADEDTQFSAVLLDSGSMEFCGSEAGETSVLAACLVLNKE